MDNVKKIQNVTRKMLLERSAVKVMDYLRERGINEDGSLMGGVFPQNQGMGGNQAA